MCFAVKTSAALDTSGALPENVNYAIKRSFLESVPEVAACLWHQSAAVCRRAATERNFEELVKAAEQAAVLVPVY